MSTDIERGQDRPDDPGPSRGARWFTGAVVGLFAAAGVAGLEAWPITGWKLFSLARDATQTRWEIEVVDGAGGVVAVDLDELPMGYRQAEWLLVQLPGAPPARRQAMCAGLFEGAGEVVPEAVELRIVRDHQRQVRDGGEWRVAHDREAFHTCRRGEGP